MTEQVSSTGSGASAEARSGWPAIAILVIAAVAFALRAVGIDYPAAGYHAFNEGFYALLSAEALEQGPLAWLLQPGDLNNPPLYPLVVTTLFRLLGASVVIARLVSAIAGAATVVYTYLLGRQLFSERAGLVAAMLLAAMPGAVLITHNAQTDGLMVLLVVAATYYYIKGREFGRGRLAFAAGVLLGLALLTKLPAILALPALAFWETLATPGLGWLKERRVRIALGGFALTGLPWHVVQMASNGAAYFQAQAGVGSSFALPDGRFFSELLFNELWWMHWPPLFVLVMAALVYAFRRRTPGDLLAITFIGVNIAFYLFFHFHTYYLLPVAPFTALLAGRLTDALAIHKRAVALAGVGVLAVGLVVASFVMLGGHKIGAFSASGAEQAIGPESVGADLWVDQGLLANFGDAIEFYVPNMVLRPLPEGSLEPGAGNLTPGARSFLLTPAQADVGLVVELAEHRREFVLFGVAIAQRPEIEHNMANGPWRIRWGAYPVFTFGLRAIEPAQPGPRLYDLDVIYGTGRTP